MGVGRGRSLMIKDKLEMCSGSLGERLAKNPVMNLELQERVLTGPEDLAGGVSQNIKVGSLESLWKMPRMHRAESRDLDIWGNIWETRVELGLLRRTHASPGQSLYPWSVRSFQ